MKRSNFIVYAKFLSSVFFMFSFPFSSLPLLFCPFVFLASLSVHYLSPCSVLLSAPPFFLTYTNTHFPIFLSLVYTGTAKPHTQTL